MNEFIEKNRRLLKFYYTAARACGWVLICGGTIWFLMFVLLTLAVNDAAGTIGWPYTVDNFVYSSSSYVFVFAMLGLVALLVAQLIRYMLESEYTPGYILRLGDKILYVYAVFLVGQNTLVHYILNPELLSTLKPGHFFFVKPLIVPLATKVLILVGLGQILPRLLNVIEESKTLV
ncbi:MAG: hypothetical protein JW837_17015 [Sedimentisphaerales bacterium]|nr:hypothetical protein [Sedimentisphaerales bacterium]